MIRIRSGLALAGLIIATAACGGSSASSPPSSEGGSQAPASSAPASSPPASLDVSGAGQAIANLTSYQAHLTTASGTADIIVIHKPTSASSFTSTSDDGTKFRIIVVGADSWVDQGAGTFVKNAVPASALDSFTRAFDPAVLFGTLASQDWIHLLTTVGTEQKNGVGTIHLRADSSTRGPAGETLPPGATFDLWIATDGGYLIALEARGVDQDGKKGDITIEMTNIDDPSNTVTPPS